MKQNSKFSYQNALQRLALVGRINFPIVCPTQVSSSLPSFFNPILREMEIKLIPTLSD